MKIQGSVALVTGSNRGLGKALVSALLEDLPIPKTSPADVASAVLAGVARGEEDIFPDPMAQQQMGALWSKSPKEYGRAFASM